MAVLLLISCAPQSVQPEQAYTTDQLLTQKAEQSLRDARDSSSPDKERHLLSAAQSYYDLNNQSQATEILAGLDSQHLPPALLAQYTELYTRILLNNNEHFRARELLTSPHLMAVFPSLATADQISLRRERGDLFSLLGEDKSALVEYVELSQLQSETGAIEATHDKIWIILSHTPDNTLHSLGTETQNPTLRGWYQLALTTRRSIGDIRLQRQQIEQWRAQWPTHPAIAIPPSNLKDAAMAAAALPAQIALLMPLTGDYGAAGTVIRNGFMAAYYDSLSKGGQVPLIRVYDTTERNVTDVYLQAVADNAKIVIGPLRKENLSALTKLDTLPVPIIALNYLDSQAESTTNAHNNFYQFGLSIADEAEQVAVRAWLEGRRSALIISPATGWGKKASAAFSQRWTSKGGAFIATKPYALNQSDFTSVIQPALLIDQSKLRAKKIQRTLGKNLEYSPRRRHDIDMIFMVAQPDQGRSIKPTLDFFYAHDLPVYATSHLYTGIGSIDLNRDLEGIRFSAMPWTLPGMVSDRLIPDSSLRSTYRHLYALGIDAYQLHQRVGLMRASPQAQFYGHTGTLTMTSGNIIKRTQPWAEFKNNRVRPIPTVREY